MNLPKNLSHAFRNLLFIFLCPVSNANSTSPAEPCPDLLAGQNSYFDSYKECTNFIANATLLESQPHQSGPELSSQNLPVVSTSKKIALARLNALASQAEAASVSSKKSTTESANAAWILGLLYLHGNSVPVDASRAKYWFQIAWQQGEQMASAGLAWCEMAGCDMPPDLSKARFWRSKLLHINRPRSLYFEWLGQAKLAPLGMSNDSDLKAGYYQIPKRELLVEAANAGDIQAHIELGIESASKNQLDEALKHFVFAERQSNVAANNATQIRAKIANENSMNKLESPKAGSKELAESNLEQARRYHKGDGVPANYSEAIRLYKKAADLGNPQAKKMLILIFSQTGENGAINILWMQKLGQMDISGSTLQLSSINEPVFLTREETGLADFIPQFWRDSGNTNKIAPLPCRPEIAPC